MSAIVTWTRRHRLVAFFGLTFLLSWWSWPFYAVDLAPTAFFPCGPLVAALIVIGIAEGRAGYRDLGARMIRWRVGWTWWLVAVGTPLAVLAVAAVANVAIWGAPAPVLATMAWSQLALNAAVRFVNPLDGPLGEEPGWRGYALPQLQARRSPLASGLVLAVFVALWHLPLVVTGQLAGVALPITFAITLVYVWLFNRTGGSRDPDAPRRPRPGRRTDRRARRGPRSFLPELGTGCSRHWPETTVVSYDRAGLGWSERGTVPRDARSMAVQLRAALRAADLPGPFCSPGIVRLAPGADVRRPVPGTDGGPGRRRRLASRPVGQRPFPRADRILAATLRATATAARLGLPWATRRPRSPTACRPARPTSCGPARRGRAPRRWRPSRWTRGRAAGPGYHAADRRATSRLVVLQDVRAAVREPDPDRMHQRMREQGANTVGRVVEGATHESLLARVTHAAYVVDAVRAVAARGNDRYRPSSRGAFRPPVAIGDRGDRRGGTGPVDSLDQLRSG